jgi:hypothetical protein
MMKAAAIASFLLGLGFGLPCAIGTRHLAQTGQIWTFLGFLTYGGGPFERFGLRTTVPLMLVYLAVCILEIVVGVMLWTEAPYAIAASFVLFPLELVFWCGFALPFGPPLGLVRLVLTGIAASR